MLTVSDDQISGWYHAHKSHNGSCSQVTQWIMLTSHTMDGQIHSIVKAIRTLFADPVMNIALNALLEYLDLHTCFMLASGYSYKRLSIF